MGIVNEVKLILFADYFQFYIQDEKVDGDLSDKWTNEAVCILLAITDGTIGVGTVRNMNVPVNLKIFDSEPPFLTDDEHVIGQINECDIEVSSGKIVIAGCTDYFPEAKRIELENGVYRARIYYGNLDKISEDGLDGEDFYEIHLWKTDKQDGIKIIRSHKKTKWMQ
ncbi:hypothetical protein [Pedobacter caeni]|uniref:Uncharacterized protein n=1 Tax=Pedobacter caeni TaxID=288992 RepID=A0A1M4VE23_9SPHI|nr:hypothetical protein [Pedobacter caeni]SHE67080.1 hypothetical protein SAMN04488522_101874 [Pedobacter caeni]